AVTGRAGLRPGAQRSDREQAELVGPRHTATPGPDLDQLDRRRPNRQARALLEALLAAGLKAKGRRGAAVVDHAGLGRGAAHVESQDTALSGHLPEVRPNQRPGGWAALEQPDRR